MASLAESFLADLDELSDNEASQEEEHAEAVNMEDVDFKPLNYDDLDDISKLQKTQYYNEMIQAPWFLFLRNFNEVSKCFSPADKLNVVPKKPPHVQKVEDSVQRGITVPSQGSILEDLEYQLIVDCNAFSVDIDNEISTVHNFIRDKYKLKLPLLKSRIQHPIDYAHVVKKIGNEMDLTQVDLKGLLPSADIMWITMTESITSRGPLSERNLVQTIEACDRVLTLDAVKKKILNFITSRMRYIAPNLAAIVGSDVASKLMVNAGGLEALAKMPACNVQLLGSKKKNPCGFSSAASQFRVGYLEQTEVFQSTPPSLRTRALRLIAAKSTLAARIDSVRGDPTRKSGENLLEEIHKRIKKWLELPPAKLPKPLPVPDSIPKKKRGGRRLRKMKERYAQTDMMKLANRMAFGVPEKSSLGDGLGKGYGLLGQAGTGKLRLSVGQSKLSAKVVKRFKENTYGSSGARSGLTSSLAFTPVQGNGTVKSVVPR